MIAKKFSWLSGLAKNFGRDFTQHISAMFREDAWFLAALLLLNLYNLLYTMTHGMVRSREMTILLTVLHYLAGAGIIFSLGLAVHFMLRRFPRLKKLVQGSIVAFSAADVIVNLFLYHKFHTMLDQEKLEIALSTDPITAKEFLQDYAVDWLVMIGVILLVIALVIAVRQLAKGLRLLAERHLKTVATVLLPFFLAFTFVSYVLIAYVALWGADIETRNAVVRIVCYLCDENLNFGRTGVDLYQAATNLNDDQIIYAEMDKQIAAEEVIPPSEKIPYVVFILGESTTRNHMQLYGYSLPTTPKLDGRWQDDSLIRFDDTIACANYTLGALSLIFTFSEKGDEVTWYTKPNVFDILRKVGYHTAWLSNQSPLGRYGNVGRIYAARADEQKFVESGGVSMSRDVDGALLPIIDDSLSHNTSEANFYVIHLTGCHQSYKSRYPAEFATFQAEEEDKPSEKGRQMTAEYDNAVLYNDYIVDEIIQRFADKDAVVIYISDHGEEVFDGREFAGHSDEGTENRHMVEIPMLVWASEQFRQRRPDKFAAIKVADDRPYQTDDMIHTLLGLMDIKTTSYDETKNLFSANFDASRPRLYNEKPYVKK